jgi:hypothetical protein
LDTPKRRNERAVSGAIDPVLTGKPLPAIFIPIALGLDNLTASQIPAGLDELSPESLQYARDIAFENATFEVQNVDGVLANLRRGYSGVDTSGLSIVDSSLDSSLGRSLSSLLAYDPPYHSAAPNGVNYYPGGSPGTPTEEETPAPATWNSSSQVISDSPSPLLSSTPPSSSKRPVFSTFISGDVILADLNKDHGLDNSPPTKGNYTAGDVAAGVAFRMTSNLSAGILFDYNHTDAKTDSYGSRTRVDSYSPGLYGTYFNHGFYANGLFSFGYNQYSNRRNIPLAGSTANSSPNGRQYVGNIDLGYDFQPKPEWIFGPVVGATYTHLDVDSFSETGAPGANLAVNSQSADSLRSRLGGHIMYQTNEGSAIFQPNFTFMWQHEYLDNSSGITSQFTSFASNPFTIQTAAPTRDSALLGLGVTATLNNSMAFYLNYMADVGTSDYLAQSVMGGFKARF